MRFGCCMVGRIMLLIRLKVFVAQLVVRPKKRAHPNYDWLNFFPLSL